MDRAASSALRLIRSGSAGRAQARLASVELPEYTQRANTSRRAQGFARPGAARSRARFARPGAASLRRGHAGVAGNSLVKEEGHSHDNPSLT
jgi:hypothetical protein